MKTTVFRGLLKSKVAGGDTMKAMLISVMIETSMRLMI